MSNPMQKIITWLLICTLLLIVKQIPAQAGFKTINDKFIILSTATDGIENSVIREGGAYLTLCTDTDGDGEIYFTNAKPNCGSKSYGLIKQLKITAVGQTEYDFPKTIYEFQWDYQNSYDENKGTATVKIVKTYKNEQVLFTAEISFVLSTDGADKRPFLNNYFTEIELETKDKKTNKSPIPDTSTSKKLVYKKLKSEEQKAPENNFITYYKLVYNGYVQPKKIIDNTTDSLVNYPQPPAQITRNYNRYWTFQDTGMGHIASPVYVETHTFILNANDNGDIAYYGPNQPVQYYQKVGHATRNCTYNGNLCTIISAKDCMGYLLYFAFYDDPSFGLEVTFGGKVWSYNLVVGKQKKIPFRKMKKMVERRRWFQV